MASERLRSGMIASRQRRALAGFVAGEVLPFSPYYRERLVGAGLTGRRLLGRAGALSRLPPTELGAVAPASFVLRPTRAAMAGSRWRWRWRADGLLGRRSRFTANVLEPLYRPIHWDRHDGVLVGSSAADLDRLGDVGRRWLELAGVEHRDIVVDLHPVPTTLAFWQLTLGCRAAGVQLVHLGSTAVPAAIADIQPMVLAGPPSVVHGALDRLRDQSSPLYRLRTLLVTGSGPLHQATAPLRGLVGLDVAILAAWAPPGVRALWAQCREAGALHTWPDTELLEIVDPSSGVGAPDGANGQLLWNGVGWRGTALLRLRTGVFGTIRRDRCPGCGRTSPRIEIVDMEPQFAAVLDGNAGVALWQAELRRVNGTEELVVYLTPTRQADLVAVLDELDEEIGVTQFVVLSRSELTRRLAAAGDARIVDRR